MNVSVIYLVIGAILAWVFFKTRNLKADGNEYFEPLITRYNNYIFSIMMRLTSGNVDFSEDLTQLSFLRALKYLNSYNIVALSGPLDKKMCFFLFQYLKCT